MMAAPHRSLLMKAGCLSYSVAALVAIHLLCSRTVSSSTTSEYKNRTKQAPPNIVVMLIDDMGWYNAPWNGNAELQERMPFLTDLSKSGVILDRHYSYKYCSPARSSFLSGRLPIHVTQNNQNNLLTNPGGADLRMQLLPSRLQQVATGSYRTACIGKWHVGARSNANLPTNRGFDEHFGFLKGGEDHFTQGSDDAGMDFVDLFHQTRPAYGRNGTYSTELYAAEAVRIIEQHAAEYNNYSESDTGQRRRRPLFMYLAWQAMHGPLEAPAAYELPLPNDGRRARCKMNAMAAILDEGVANVTKALRRTGIYDDTLLVVSSDNGGWIQMDHGGNNYPLRGGKVTDFEGGVRTAAFVAGGVLEQQAPHLTGTRSSLLIHLVDWYATLIGLAHNNSRGDSPDDDTSSKDTTLQSNFHFSNERSDKDDEVPPVDSRDFWQALVSPNSSSVTAIRREIPLSFCNDDAQCDWPGGVGDAALISWPWKLVNGTQAGLGLWQGQQFPNASQHIPQPGTDPGCPHGCLFDIEKDPTEHEDVKDQNPGVFDRLRSRLLEIGKGVYQTNYDGGANTCLPVEDAYRRDRGFLSPRCSRADQGNINENTKET